MKHLRKLNKYFWKYKYRFVLGMLFVISSNIFGLYPPQILRLSVNIITDNIALYKLFDGFQIQEKNFFIINSTIFILSLALISMVIIKGIFMFFMRQSIIVMSRLIEFDLKNDIYIHYQKLHSGFYKMNSTGDLMSRATEDVNKVRMYLGPAIMYTINLVTLFILVITTMFRINAFLSFIVLLPLPLLSISIYKVSSVINKKSEVIQGKLSGLTSMAQEVFSGIRVIKSYVRENTYNSQFDIASTDYKKNYLQLSKIEAFFAPLMLLLIGLSTILTVYIGGIEVSKGRFTAGNIAEFVFYINMLTWPVASLGWVASLVQRAAASQKRINQFLLTEPEIYNTEEKPIEEIKEISFKQLNFTYDNTGIEALKSISFDIKQGQQFAIIGKTGTGKSTIAELLLRSFDPSSGDLLVNNHPLKELDVYALRRAIGYIPQDVFLFSATVSDNIRFGLESSNQEEIEAAAKLAQVHNDILYLTHGYDTMVGERGVTLSGGQKQRISIARALVKNPSLLILDDCLSAVDANTEHLILNNFKRAFNQKTVIFITHRIFSLMDFDRILVLDEGQIKEQGSHQELLDKRGLYWDMYQLQQQENADLEQKFV